MAHGLSGKYPVNEVIGFDQDLPGAIEERNGQPVCSNLKNVPSAPPVTTRENIMSDSTEMLELLHQINGKVDRLSEESATHTRILEEHGRILGKHTCILEEHGRILEEHGRILGEHGRTLEGHGSILEEQTRTLATMQQDILHLRTVQDSHTHLLNNHAELLNVHTATLNIVLQDMRLLRGAVIDVAKREVLTPGQLMVLHEDMNRLHFQVSEVAVRIETIEARLPH